MTATTADFPRFVESLRAPGSHTALSPTAVAQALDLSMQRLASLAGVHRNTASYAPTSPKLQDAMVDMLRVLSAANQLNGDMDKALFWFRTTPIQELDHFTALQLVEQGKAQVVVDYIDSLRAGAAG